MPHADQHGVAVTHVTRDVRPLSRASGEQDGRRSGAAALRWRSVSGGAPAGATRATTNRKGLIVRTSQDRLTAVLDQVAAEKTPVTITKRGRPVATVVPLSAAATPAKRLAGSVLRERGTPYRTGERWDADVS